LRTNNHYDRKGEGKERRAKESDVRGSHQCVKINKIDRIIVGEVDKGEREAQGGESGR